MFSVLTWELLFVLFYGYCSLNTQLKVPASRSCSISGRPRRVIELNCVLCGRCCLLYRFLIWSRKETMSSSLISKHKLSQFPWLKCSIINFVTLLLCTEHFGTVLLKPFVCQTCRSQSTHTSIQYLYILAWKIIHKPNQFSLFTLL